MSREVMSMRCFWSFQGSVNQIWLGSNLSSPSPANSSSFLRFSSHCTQSCYPKLTHSVFATWLLSVLPRLLECETTKIRIGGWSRPLWALEDVVRLQVLSSTRWDISGGFWAAEEHELTSLYRTHSHRHVHRARRESGQKRTHEDGMAMTQPKGQGWVVRGLGVVHSRSLKS
jgi:hypothetical protein